MTTIFKPSAESPLPEEDQLRLVMSLMKVLNNVKPGPEDTTEQLVAARLSALFDAAAMVCELQERIADDQVCRETVIELCRAALYAKRPTSGLVISRIN